ncbi:MAG: HYR domain-containing protein [Acidobacteriota bacterium]|nr:HYR domain-containing protein [Acidobacteriota bacterium]
MRSSRSNQSAYRSKFILPLFNSTFRKSLILMAMIAVSLSAAVWQSDASASNNSAIGKLRRAVRSALTWTAMIPAQGGIGSRTMISTIAGGGFSTSAPVKQAPMVLPTAVAIDPKGRGFYVVDDLSGTSLLRFVNTTGTPVTLGGVTIQSGHINLLAGGGIAPESTSPLDIDLTQVTGIAVDPSGDVVYLATPIVAAFRALNVGTQDFTILRQTIQPGTIKTIFNVGRTDFRALTINASREFFYIGAAQTGGARLVYKLEPTGNNNAGLETIYAGGGTPQFGNGDGQQATQAKLTTPMGLAIDTNGNLLIAEGGDTRGNPGAVRRVDPGGVIQSLISNLEFPTGIVLGPANSMYVALGNAQQVIRVSSLGQKTIVAGVNPAAACDQQNNPGCGDGTAAISANLNLPGSTQLRNLTLAADANGFFLPDFNFRRVRYVNLGGATVNIAGTSISGGQITTVAGSGQEAPYDNVPAPVTELQMAAGVAEDINGNLFIADTNADPVGSIRFINRGQNPVTLFAGTAWEMTAQPGQIITLNNRAGEMVVDDRIATAVFASPQGIFTTANGLYIVDSQYGALIRPPNSLNGRRSGHIRFLNTSSADVTIFPNGGAAKVVVPPGHIKDIVGRNDAPLPGSPTADDSAAHQAIIFPTDVALDAAGNIYIADQGNNRIRKVNPLTGQVTSLMTTGTEGATPFVTGGACGIYVTPTGRVYMANTKTDTIVRQDAPNSTSFTTIANATKGINRPRDLTVDAAGNVFVANAGSDQVLRIVAPTNALGTSTVVAGTGVAGFSGDGGPGNQAKLNFLNPGITAADIQVTTSIITLGNGDMAFADSENNRIRLLVQLPNQNPVLAAVANQSVNEGQTATVSFSATDGNQDPLVFSMQNAPSFATLTDAGNGTASLQLAPGFSDAGTYNVTVSVNDGDATDSKNFTITVADVNRAPVVNVTPISPTYEATGPNGRQVNLLATASDPDNDPLSYQWFNFQTQIATVLTPQVTLPIGTHSLFLTATDSKGLSTSSSAFAVIVRDSTPPVISGVPADITIQATATEGIVVNYTLPTALDQVDGVVGVTADKSPGSLFPVGETTVNFTAKDSRNNQATASFKVTVTPKPGDPPPPPPPPPGGGGESGCNATGYTISTYAGSGNYGFAGDGGMAVDAALRSVSQLTNNGTGLMVVDSQSRVVRHIDGQTVIRTIAGNSSNGNTGDGNQANYATFGATGGAAVDTNGNTYVSDTNFHRIRRIAPDGKIFHFAGATNGTSGSGGDNGSAASARFNRPTSLAVDAQNNLYVSDSGNNRVRVINLTTNIVTNYAGTGGAGYNNDGVIATNSSLNNPAGISLDAAGNLFIADRNNHRIRRVDAVSKLMTTVAGDGNQGFGGDGGAAISAQLSGPADVTVDGGGNVYIADQINHRVRRVKTNGTIETIAGNGTAGFTGDGGAGTSAQLNSPASLELDADCSLFVGDSNNLRIRKLMPSSTGGTTNRNPVITSTIGNQTMTKGQALTLPLTATDEDNDMITFSLVNAPAFADIINQNPTGRTATLRLQPTTAGTFDNIQVRASDGRGGVATSAAFSITVNEPAPGNQPPTANAGQLPATLEAIFATGAPVNLNGSGSDPDGDPVTFSWMDNGNVIATSAVTTVTLGIGTHSIVLKVSDNKGANTSTTAQTVVVRDTTPPTIAGVPAAITTAATSAAGANINYTMPTATDLVDGVVQVVADKASGSLFAVGATTVRFTATDSRGNAATAQFIVTITPFVSGGTPTSYNISTFAGSGNYGFSGDGGQAIDAAMKQITAITRAEAGLMIADSVGRVVRRVDAQGVIRTIAGNSANGNGGDGGQANFAQISAPSGVVTDANGNTYVSDTAFHRIRRIASDGKIFHFAGSTTGVSGSIGDNGVAASARFNRPTALAVDAQNLYIVDSGNHRVRAINLTTNIVTTVAGNGGAGYGGDDVLATIASLNNPSGLTLDAAGNLFIADRSNHRVRKVDAVTKLISTIAGNGEPGFAGDSNQAATAQLNSPTDVAVDAAGNVFIVDQTNNRVRRVNAAGVIETIAGNGTVGYSGDGGPALQAQITQPTAIEVESDGSILVGDNGNLRVRKLTPAGPPPPPPPPANNNPVITSTIGNQTVTKGQTLDLPLSATDADGDNVTFSLVNAPAFATIINANPAARTATLRLAPTVAGSFANVQVKADDGKGGSATSAVFSITVNEPPPTNQCINVVPANHWKGEYFPNIGLSGSPTLVRDDGDGSLNLSFGENSPNLSCGIPIDNFSARYTREVSFQAGVYRFQLFGDDGIRLYINGQLRIDKWFNQAETKYEVDVPLTAGTHQLRVEHYEAGGSAAARLFWNALNYYPTISTIPNQTVRRGQSLDVVVTANDTDNDPVTFELVNAPTFVSLVNANPVGRSVTLRIAPPTVSDTADQQFNMSLRASDNKGGQSLSNQFTITTTSTPPPPPPPTNRAPVAVANTLAAAITAPDATGATIALDGSASSDPDGDVLTYSWTDHGIVIATTAVASVKLPVGAHLIALTVSDGKGGVNSTAAQSVTINAPPPPPPVGLAVDSVSPSFGKKGTTLTVMVNGTGFIPGATATINGGQITTSTTFISSTQLSVRVTIASNAFTTTRSVTVANPGGTSAAKSNAFSVIP